MWYISTHGNIEIELTKEEAHMGSHSGACDNDVAYLRTLPHIKEQLDKIDPKDLSEELKGYGAWDDAELANHDDNIDRILWLACGDIVDGNGFE